MPLYVCSFLEQVLDILERHGSNAIPSVSSGQALVDDLSPEEAGDLAYLYLPDEDEANNKNPRYGWPF